MKMPFFSRSAPFRFRAGLASLLTLFACAPLSRGAVPGFATLVEFTGTTGSQPGATPYAGLFQASDGDYYGTTSLGGTANVGSVYRVTSSGTFTSLRSFTGAAQPTGGLYPVAGLAQHTDGTFYGSTSGDYQNNGGYGILFKISPNGQTFSNYAILTGFAGNYKGVQPMGAMIKASDGNFYGTTQYGGTGTVNYGTLFKVTSAGAFSTQIEFSNNSTNNKGASPNGKLLDGGNGFLYGTTVSGGASTFGTVFKFKLSNGALTTLAAFTGSSGQYPGKSPIGALMLASDGNIYGTTANGGTTNSGVIFRVNRSTDAVTTLAQFTDYTGTVKGALPIGGLAQGNDGYLYGATRNGPGSSGSEDYGTIYRMSTGGVLTPQVFNFTGTSGDVKGKNPYGDLIKGTDGYIYGTTLAGGSSDKGTVFRLDTSLITTGGPVVTTGDATSVTTTSATLAGTVNPNGLATTWQFEYGTTTSYGSVMPLTATAAGNGTAALSVSTALSGLTAGTTYNYRIKATNVNGTTTGSNATFTTVGGSSAPVVVTGSATSIGNNTATLNATVNPSGLATTWQFEYGTTTSYGSMMPVTPGSLTAGSSAQAVSIALTGLAPGTTWHFRIKATNDNGTTTGSDVTFSTTGTPQAPLVVTGAALSITGTSGTLNGTVNSQGSPTTWQFEYGADLSYGSSIPLTPSNINTGTSDPVSITLGGLSPGTTVYYRLKATNTVGTVYGSGGSFTTAQPPAVVTQAAIAITTTGATLLGTVNPNGVSSTWQYEYGTDTSYGQVAPAQPGTTGTGNSPETVPFNLSGITPGATIHYRLKAVNSAGTAYGADLVFTTKQPPTVLTSTVSNLTSKTATLNGSVNPRGVAATWQFEYGTTTAYGQTLPVTAGDAGSGNVPVNVNVALSGLEPNTLYHYRLKAVSTYGTSTTTDAVFTTSGNLASWRLAHFGSSENTGNAANNADPDGDGISNLFEYAFGLNPNANDAGSFPKPSFNGSVLLASFNTPAGVGDITYGAEVSTNLNSWSSIADSGSGTAHTFAAPVSPNGRTYMRFRVTVKP